MKLVYINIKNINISFMPFAGKEHGSECSYWRHNTWCKLQLHTGFCEVWPYVHACIADLCLAVFV